MKTYVLFLLVFSVVLISRLPFLDAGYGTDTDGCRVATAARYIATTGEYKASRLPGFPIIEFTCSLAWKNGARFLNLLTAFMSAIAVGMLAIIAKKYGCKDFLLIAFTFAFTPVVYISSTITMDYMWAIMFVMFCWYAGLFGKPFVAGSLLGIAIGCRITTAAMTLPFALLFLDHDNWKLSFIRILKFWCAAAVVAITAFLPVFLTYGWHFFTFFGPAFPPIATILKTITLDVWGIVGFSAISIISFLVLVRKKTIHIVSLTSLFLQRNFSVCIAVLILFVIEYAIHPKDPGYLIPPIPFFLLIIARYFPRRQFVLMCGLIILSSFVGTIDSIDRPWSPKPSKLSILLDISGRSIAVDLLGPIFNDHERRLQQMRFVQAVIATSDSIGYKSAVVAGAWLPSIIENTQGSIPESEFSDFSMKRNNVEFVNLMDKRLLLRFKKNGYRIYYLKTVEGYNYSVNAIDLRKEGAIELIPGKI
jgi:hypothetical protein